MDFLLEGFKALTWQQVVMWVIGGLLIYLAIKKDMEPALLLPMGFGAILVNLPLSPVIGSGESGEHLGIIASLFKVGIEASEAMPLLLFMRAVCLTNSRLFESSKRTSWLINISFTRVVHLDFLHFQRRRRLVYEFECNSKES